LEWFLLAAGTDHFDKSRRPTDKCRVACRLVCVLREGAHEGQIDVDVWVDEPGKDILSGSINYISIARRRKIAIDPGNRFAFAKDIRNITFAGGDNFAALNQKAHVLLLPDVADALAKPPRADHLLPSVKLYSFLSLDVQIAVKRIIPTGEGKHRHRCRHADVDSNHPGLN